MLDVFVLIFAMEPCGLGNVDIGTLGDGKPPQKVSLSDSSKPACAAKDIAIADAMPPPPPFHAGEWTKPG